MRLGTCIALELVVAAGAVGGLWFGVGRATEVTGVYFEGQQAAAAVPMSGHRPTPLPGAQLAVPPVEVGTVFAQVDGELLAPLGATRVTHVKLNHGGTSLSMRVDFASGARAAFKPEQTHPQSDPRREIAAFRLDRLLGIGHVPPAKAIAIPLEELIAGAEPGYHTYLTNRLTEEGIVRDGMLHGELSWWIPEIKVAKIGPYHVDEHDGRAVWSTYLQAGAKVPDEARPMIEQIAAVILFDILIDNPDRWSGNNMLASPDQRVLYFMDNTLSFSTFTLGHEANLDPLHEIQVFPRRLVGKIRGLTLASLTEAIGTTEELGPLLTPAELRAILTRRDHLLQYIDGLIAELGEDAVLGLP